MSEHRSSPVVRRALEVVLLGWMVLLSGCMTEGAGSALERDPRMFRGFFDEVTLPLGVGLVVMQRWPHEKARPGRTMHPEETVIGSWEGLRELSEWLERHRSTLESLKVRGEMGLIVEYCDLEFFMDGRAWGEYISKRIRLFGYVNPSTDARQFEEADLEALSAIFSKHGHRIDCCEACKRE